MKRMIVCVLAASALAAPAYAKLESGAKAPMFDTQASLAGKAFNFSMKDALKKGPVVLYFYPAAFTPGCTAEAHEFSEQVDNFKKAGATIVGVSTDKIEVLNRFSTEVCRDKFAVAADGDSKISQSYDAVSTTNPARSARTSYVISPKGEVIYSYTDANYAKHVANTLEAVQGWAAKNKKG